MKKLLVLDGNSIINRAFYGVRNLSNSKGMPTNALFGFVNIVKKYMDSISPDFMICTYDMHHPTFRHERYDLYKSNRHGMPEELAIQFPYAKQLIRALGFTLLESQGYEADDLIGTVCRAADLREDITSYILTGDRDSLQLISDRTNVILMRNKEDEFFDRTHFFDTYGIQPEQFVDVKALMGDSSDCIPGVAGIGEKTALKLISAAGSLDALFEASKDGYFGATPSVKRKLDEGRSSAYLSKELATICTDSPVGKDIDSYRRKDIDRGELYSLFREFEFGNLIGKFHLSSDDLKDTAELTKVNGVIKYVTKNDLLNVRLPDVISVTLESGRLCVYSKGQVLVCENIDDEVLRHVAQSRIICHDLKSLCKSFGSVSAEIKCEFDTMLGKYLLDPGRGTYPFEQICEFLGVESAEDPDGKAEAIAICAEKLKSALSDVGQLDLLYNIELPLAKVLADIETVGFKVDRNGIKEYARQLLEMEDSLAGDIFSHAGHDFNINSPKQLGVILFEELGLPSLKKTKTGYATDAETLQKLRFYHPIISDILSYRQVTKLRGTYGDALADTADEADRIHTSLNQCGTATGRLSSNDPNLQNIPVRDELGRELRRFFTASDDEHILIDADYSQIELRLLAHLSADKNMIDAFCSDIDVHTMTAAKVFKVAPENVTKELRLRAKAVNFGIVYGIGPYSLSQDIGCSRKQAEEYINSYFETYPRVKEYLSRTVDEAMESGYTTTMFGRRRNIPELRSSNKNLAAFGKRVAMNSPIQGTAADIIKIAMINVARALKEADIDARIILQVHDELIVESHISCKEEAEAILVGEMANAAELLVPLVAESGVGKTWLEAK